MKELMTTITAGKMEQDRIQALECCYKGWDDSIDVDTILEGVKARYRAFNNPVMGELAIRRLNLFHVEIYQVIDRQIVVLLNFSSHNAVPTQIAPTEYFCRLESGRYLRTEVLDIYYFYQTEMREMGAWLLANFYHQ